MTKEQLVAFMRRRNKSDYNSNLQFQIDAEASGFKVSDLGTVKPIEMEGIKAYEWATPHGKLIENCGKMSLHP